MTVAFKLQKIIADFAPNQLMVVEDKPSSQMAVVGGPYYSRAYQSPNYVITLKDYKQDKIFWKANISPGTDG